MLHYLPLNEYAITIYDHEFPLSYLEQNLINNPFRGFLETSLAYISLTVYYDPLQITRQDVIQHLNLLSIQNDNNSISVNEETFRIPVCYEYGPDLKYVAEYNQLSEQEVVVLHTSSVYKVHMIGFMPGFPYLSGLSEQLATPRKQTPRAHVAAGSVGIAGTQTGVYPLNSPGGWQIIGRTPYSLFDIERDPPSLLKAGQLICFQAITKEEFNNLSIKN